MSPPSSAKKNLNHRCQISTPKLQSYSSSPPISRSPSKTRRGDQALKIDADKAAHAPSPRSPHGGSLPRLEATHEKFYGSLFINRTCNDSEDKKSLENLDSTRAADRFTLAAGESWTPVTERRNRSLHIRFFTAATRRLVSDPASAHN